MEDIEHYFQKVGRLNICGLDKNELELVKGKKLGETKNTIVWKG